MKADRSGMQGDRADLGYLVSCERIGAVSNATLIVIDHRHGASITAYRRYTGSGSTVRKDGTNIYDHAPRFFLTVH